MTEEQKRLQQQNNQIQQNTTPAPAVQQNTAPAVQQPSTPAPAVQQSQPSAQQQAADTAFNQTMGALQAASKPTYNPSYDGQIKDIFGIPWNSQGKRPSQERELFSSSVNH